MAGAGRARKQLQRRFANIYGPRGCNAPPPPYIPAAAHSPNNGRWGGSRRHGARKKKGAGGLRPYTHFSKWPFACRRRRRETVGFSRGSAGGCITERERASFFPHGKREKKTEGRRGARGRGGCRRGSGR